MTGQLFPQPSPHYQSLYPSLFPLGWIRTVPCLEGPSVWPLPTVPLACCWAVLTDHSGWGLQWQVCAHLAGLDITQLAV